MKNNLKRFDSFVNEKLSYTDREMTSAEKRSKEKGHDVLTKAQLAAIYAIEKKWLKEIGLHNTDATTFADVIGMKTNTFNHTAKKVKNIIAGEPVHPNESFSQKYKDYVDEFVKADKAEVCDLAMKAIEDAPASKNVKSKSKVDQKKEDAKVVNAIADYVRAKVPAEKAVKTVAGKLGLEVKAVEKIWANRLTESEGSHERQCTVKITSQFDSGFAEWVKDMKVLDHIGSVSYSQSGDAEIVTVKCSSLRLAEVIKVVNSNTEGNLDEYVSKIVITYA